jgi:catechol 2,3-dioxygenase-like lactoylglutathione lyase family enzyme
MPRLNGIIETAIHVRDLSASAGFYQQVLGLELIERSERLCAMNVAGRHLLLLFLQGGSTEPVEIAGGTIPPHDGSGSLHFAFAIDRSELAPWEQRLRENGVPVESRVDWGLGGTSLYFRDPDGHLVELATPGNWPIY